MPLQSLAVVKHLLQKNNIPVDPVDDARLSSYTVRSVVLSMTKMNFIVVDKSFEYSSIFVAVSERLKRCLEGFIEQDNLKFKLPPLSPRHRAVTNISLLESSPGGSSSNFLYASSYSTPAAITSNYITSQTPNIKLDVKGMCDFIATSIGINSSGLNISRTQLHLLKLNSKL